MSCNCKKDLKSRKWRRFATKPVSKSEPVVNNVKTKK